MSTAPETIVFIHGLWMTPRSSSPVLRNPFNRGKAIPLDEKQFHYAFANTLSQEESDEIYKRYHVPAAASVLFDIAFANLHRHPIRRSTSSATIARRCSSSPSTRTTSFRRTQAATTPRSTRSRAQSPSSRSSTDGRTSRAHPAGKRSPTSPSTGRRGMPAPRRRRSPAPQPATSSRREPARGALRGSLVLRRLCAPGRPRRP